MNRTTQTQHDVPLREFIQDVPGIRQRAGQPVQFRHDQRVTGSARGQRQSQTRPFSVRAGQTVINIDPVITHTEGVQAITLSSEVLLLRRYSCVSHQKFIHLPAMTQLERRSQVPTTIRRGLSGWLPWGRPGDLFLT
jgi:hypothetical protein